MACFLVVAMVVCHKEILGVATVVVGMLYCIVLVAVSVVLNAGLVVVEDKLYSFARDVHRDVISGMWTTFLYSDMVGLRQYVSAVLKHYSGI